MLRIIIAEDDEITRNLCVEYLTYKNLEVEAYENGEKVLEKMRSGKVYDKVLTDYIMNGSKINGLELTKQIKNEFGDIPVFIMSGSDIKK